MTEQRIRSPYAIYRRLEGLPLGRWLFTRLICLRAPYFSSIRPVFRDLGPGSATVFIRKRRRVQNHIGTIHALAMGNLCELGAGLVMESTLPPELRWIPKGMSISYLAKAETDITAVATLQERPWGTAADVPVEVSVRDAGGTEVVHATITMYVSAGKPTPTDDA
jgi:acyl-coenzyme A thioesterase PaaI-like protein